MKESRERGFAAAEGELALSSQAKGSIPDETLESGRHAVRAEEATYALSAGESFRSKTEACGLFTARFFIIQGGNQHGTKNTTL